MCKNVDDYIKRDLCDKGLCRDLRNLAGNESIDPYVCECMAPALFVCATPVPLVEYISLVPVVSYAAPVHAGYAAPTPMVEYIAPALAVIATPTSLFRYIAPSSAVSFVAPAPVKNASPAPVVSTLRQHPS